MYHINLFNRIGTKVLFAFLIAITPLIGTIASLNFHMHDDAMVAARDLVSRAAFEAAADQSAFLAELQGRLRQLATLEETQTPCPAPLTSTLHRATLGKPALANLFLCDTAGHIVASAAPGIVGRDLGRQRSVADALKRHAPEFGYSGRSPVTGKPVVHMTQPVRNALGKTVGVLVASLNILGAVQLFTRLGLPKGGFLEMIDSAGTRLWRYPPSPGYPSGHRLDTALRNEFLGRSGFGSFVTAAPDAPGGEAMLAFRQVCTATAGSPPVGAIVVGLPVRMAMASARERLCFSVATSACSIILAIFLAVVLGRRVIVRRLHVLAGLVSEVKADRVCLLPNDFGTDEIGVLGRHFTDLSRELHDKSRTLNETMAHLREEKTQLQAVVGQLGEAQSELERRANFDALTGLRNRRSFNDRLRSEFSLWRRHTTPLSLVLLDIDDFKRVNDTFGHWAGDETLRTVAGRAKHGLRASDEAYRVGGEEFALILPHTRAEAALVVAERVRSAVAESMIPLSDGGRVHVTVSLGLAECRPGTPAQKDLYTAADRALYQAKRLGKNRVIMDKIADAPDDAPLPGRAEGPFSA